MFLSAAPAAATLVAAYYWTFILPRNYKFTNLPSTPSGGADSTKDQKDLTETAKRLEGERLRQKRRNAGTFFAILVAVMGIAYKSFTSAETYYDVLRLSPSDSPSDLEMAVAQRLAVFREAGGPDYDWDRERTGKSRFGLDKIGNEKQLRKMAETLLSSTARRRYGNYGDYFRISVANMTETSIMATNFQAHFMAILSAIFFYLVGHLLTSSASFKCARPLVAFSCLGMLMAEFGLRETESVTIFGLLPFQIIRALHAFFPFVLLASIAIGRRFLLKPQLTDEKLRTLAKLQLLILKQQRDARS